MHKVCEGDKEEKEGKSQIVKDRAWQVENVPLYSEGSGGVLQWKASQQVCNMVSFKLGYNFSKNRRGDGLKRTLLNSGKAERKLLQSIEYSILDNEILVALESKPES